MFYSRSVFLGPALFYNSLSGTVCHDLCKNLFMEIQQLGRIVYDVHGDDMLSSIQNATALSK